MKADLKSFYSIDIENPLKEFSPEIEDNFGFWARMIIGEKTKDGEESFDIMICTPKWLMANHNTSEILFGLHYLIVFEYNYQKIYDKLKRFIENIEGKTWNEIGLKIGMIGKWEFEDYQK